MTTTYYALTNVSNFTFAPGEQDTVNCQLCGTECEVTRNVDGPTSLAEAISRNKRLHDSFSCPNINTDWHHEATRFAGELQKTHSPRLRRLIIADIIDVLRENGISEIQLTRIPSID